VLRLAYIVIFAMLISFLGDLSNLMDIVGLAMLVILCNRLGVDRFGVEAIMLWIHLCKWHICGPTIIPTSSFDMS
jgi:hypothetical protein